MSPHQGHGRGNHHHHNHQHHEQSEQSGTVTEREKLAKILDHWVKHNDDHAKNYRQWAQKAHEMGLSEVAQYLMQAADMTDDISGKFRRAEEVLQ